MHKGYQNQLINLFSALGDPVRFTIYENLVAAKKVGLKINLLEAIRPHKLVRSSISHHTNILVQAGLVFREKIGKNVYLEINPNALDQVREFLDRN